MSTEPLTGSEAISVRELADMRSAGKEHMVLDVREARELDVCRLEGVCIFQWRRFGLGPTTSQRINSWWSFVITAFEVKWSSSFFEAPALTMQSTSTAASMPGLAILTHQCRAIASVHSRGKCDHARD
jgi:hypothetical protein